MNGKRALFIVFLMLPSFFSAGCSPHRYKREADREVYDIIDSKGGDVPGMQEEFSAERREEKIIEKLPSVSGEEGDVEYGESDADAEEFLKLDLENALRLAAVNSREYQNQRESVFLQALSLTGERNRFSPQFFWGLRGETAYDSDDKWSVEGRSGPEARWLLSSGARLSADLSTTAVRFLSGDVRSAASSVFDLTLTQPLLREGRSTVLEPLVQAERDMVYALRDFVRFQRRFMVGVLADYYRVLEQHQRVENERINYENLQRIRRRSDALGEAGRLPELQVDRARQNELSASDSLEQALERYHRALDDFKMSLGLAPETPIVLDPRELDSLHEVDMARPPVSREESIELALVNRLDLATERERVGDAERKVLTARKALEPGLDFVLGTRAGTERNKPLSFAEGTQTSFARLDADLPLERTEERNTYRRRLIEHDRSIRGLNEKRDAVVLEVRNRWRDFERAVSSHEIQKRSVALAEERVESTEMLFDAGRASTRDVLDAHEDLLRAQNRLAQTLVDFRVSVLELERDLDILVVDEKGQIKEGVGYHEYTHAE